jgi:diguanylate cyclase (GGDEF)-like protein
VLRIVLDIENLRRREALADALRAIPAELIELSPGPAVNDICLSADVLISDRVRPRAGIVPEDGPDAGQAELAVVAIGGSGPADVLLPADATPREVTLAATLLGEIVRLRRERRESQRERRQVWQLAHTDPLTGIPNRRAWDQELPRRLQQARAAQRRLVLAIFDLDHFKLVNDRLGHAAGDEVLRHVGHTLQSSVRACDFVARVGGDEFGLLLADCHAPAVVLERIVQALAANVAASVGYAEPGPDDTAATLFERADAALRRAKSAVS